MALPWLIGGAIAAGLAAYAALSNDEKPSSNSSGSGDAEPQLKAAAEKERRERERTQKQEAALEDFRKQGRDFGRSLAQALPSDLVKADSREKFELDFDLKKGGLQFDMEEASLRDKNLFAAIDGLECILTQRVSHRKIIENLVTFSELYKPEFRCGAELRKKKDRVKRLDDGIQKLKEIKVQLMRLESESLSSQA